MEAVERALTVDVDRQRGHGKLRQHGNRVIFCVPGSSRGAEVARHNPKDGNDCFVEAVDLYNRLSSASEVCLTRLQPQTVRDKRASEVAV